MYSMLFTLAAKYGSKILIGLGVFLFLTGLYFYWQHKIYTEGYDKATAEWQKREEKINRQTTELLKLKNHEIELAVKANSTRYTNAITEYVKNNEERMRVLTTDYDKRLRVKAKCSSGGNPLPAAANIPGGNSQGRESLDFAELAAEDSRALRVTAAEVDKMASVCKQALDFIEQNGMAK